MLWVNFLRVVCCMVSTVSPVTFGSLVVAVTVFLVHRDFRCPAFPACPTCRSCPGASVEMRYTWLSTDKSLILLAARILGKSTVMCRTTVLHTRWAWLQQGPAGGELWHQQRILGVVAESSSTTKERRSDCDVCVEDARW